MEAGFQVVGYVRVSTGRQGESGAGLDAQRATIEQECARRGWLLLDVLEDVQSGKSLARPGLNAALKLLENGSARGLVVAKLDRLSRSLADFAGLVERSRSKGWELVVADLNVDTTTPTGEAMASMLAVFAQWERRMIGQRTKEALAVRRAQGVRLGRPPTLDPATRARILEWAAEGYSYGRIAERLNTRREPTAHNGRRWYASTVRSIALRG